MKTICIIPARGNSVRIPRKNIKLFHGKPIIEYSIETAQKSRLFDSVVVSTDNADIYYAAMNAGAALYRRPVADDGGRGTQEVAAEVLRSGEYSDVSMACVLYATAPLLQEFDLWFGLQGLAKTGTVFSYSTDPDGNDIGGYYWGPAFAFGKVPLESPFVNKMAIRANRAIDINTMDDWNRAEEMYAALNR